MHALVNLLLACDAPLYSNEEDICFHFFQIPVARTIAVFLTHNPHASNKPLPKEVKGFFRSVAMVKPDYCQIIKAKCTALGFKAPHVLSHRIKIACDLAQDQL